jgi:hypothetical protein
MDKMKNPTLKDILKVLHKLSYKVLKNNDPDYIYYGRIFDFVTELIEEECEEMRIKDLDFHLSEKQVNIFLKCYLYCCPSYGENKKLDENSYLKFDKIPEVVLINGIWKENVSGVKKFSPEILIKEERPKLLLPPSESNSPDLEEQMSPFVRSGRFYNSSLKSTKEEKVCIKQKLVTYIKILIQDFEDSSNPMDQYKKLPYVELLKLLEKIETLSISEIPNLSNSVPVPILRRLQDAMKF